VIFRVTQPPATDRAARSLTPSTSLSPNGLLQNEVSVQFAFNTPLQRSDSEWRQEPFLLNRRLGATARNGECAVGGLEEST